MTEFLPLYWLASNVVLLPRRQREMRIDGDPLPPYGERVFGRPPAPKSAQVIPLRPRPRPGTDDASAP